MSAGRCRQTGKSVRVRVVRYGVDEVRPPVNVNARARKWQKKRCDKMLAKVMLYYTM